MVTDNYEELIEDVGNEFGEDIKTEVVEWAMSSKEGDTFEKWGMCIINISK